MRKLTIIKTVDGKEFQQNDNSLILCTFNLEKTCTPSCASCDINTNTTQVRCLRMNEDFGYVSIS